MRVIGLCRFSYLGQGGFQTEHRSLEERAEFLYSPPRIEERFRTFETITLPPLRAQSDPDFTFLIVTGDSLPAHYRIRLEALVADMPQVVIQSHPPGRHRSILQEAINSVKESADETTLQFRMDDDDAVSCSFVKTLRKRAEDIHPLLESYGTIAIDFNQGFIVSPGADGIAVAPVKQPYWTPALALFSRAENPLTIMNFAHHEIAHKMPTVTFTGRDMMLRGYNRFNDSGMGVPKLKLLDPEGEAHFFWISI